jgi:hypothetical protein
MGEATEESFNGPITRVVPAEAITTAKEEGGDRELLTLLRKLTPEETFKYLRKVLPFADFYDDYGPVLTDDAPADVREATWDYLLPKYQKLASLAASRPLTFIKPRGAALQSGTLTPTYFSDLPALPRLRATRAGSGGYKVELRWTLDDVPVAATDIDVLNPALVCHDGRLYSVEKTGQAEVVARFAADGVLNISAEGWPAFLEDTLLPWRAAVPVDFGPDMVVRTAAAPPAGSSLSPRARRPADFRARLSVRRH